MSINKRSGWWLVLIAVIYLVAIYVIGCYDAHALTAQVTWDIGDEPDLFGYTFLYKVDNGEWLPHRNGYVIPLAGMEQRDGRTGRRFTAPDNGKTFRLQPLAVDVAGNTSVCGRVVVITTLTQEVTTEDCIVLSPAPPPDKPEIGP